MLIRYGSATAAMAFSMNLISVNFAVSIPAKIKGPNALQELFLYKIVATIMHVFIYNSPLGTLQVTADEQHILAVEFCNKELAANNLEKEKPTAIPITPLLQQCNQQLNAYFDGSNLQFNLPILQSGTEFQQKVWAGLLNIKAGQTLSYLSFSKQLGNTKAIRAVGTANGRNNIAIIVPCHRVIGSNGQLVGYAGGLWRKQWLLQHEAKHCNGVQSLFNNTSLQTSSI